MGSDDAIIVLATKNKEMWIYRVFYTQAPENYFSKHYILNNKKRIKLVSNICLDRFTANTIAQSKHETEHGIIFIDYNINIED